MKILRGDKGHVDFDMPIKMTEEQRKKFVEFMSSLFYDVEEDIFEKTRTERIGNKSFGVPWSAKEIFLLFKVENTKTVSRKLGRTWMSIVTKRGAKLPQFLYWIHEKKIELSEITEDLVKKYMEEIELKKLDKKKKRQELGLIQKRIKSIDGCVVGTNEYGGECKGGFHKGCITCPHSKGFIKTQEDIGKFNKVWKGILSK